MQLSVVSATAQIVKRFLTSQMSTARRTPQGCQQKPFKQLLCLLTAFLCLVPLPTRAYETPLLNHSGSLPASPTALSTNIKDQQALTHEQLQQRLQLVSHIRQQSIVDTDASGHRANVAGNATINVTTGVNFPTGGMLYFGGAGIPFGLLLTKWHQHPAATQMAAAEESEQRKLFVAQNMTGSATGQAGFDAAINSTTNIRATTSAARGESAGAIFTVPHPPTVRTPAYRTLRQKRSLSRAQGISMRTATATAAPAAADSAAATGAARVPAGGDEGVSGKPLRSKRALLSVSDSVGAAQNKGPVPAPAEGAVTPSQRRQQQQQQQQRSVINGVQAVRRAAIVTAAAIPNNAFTPEQGAARVLPGGGRGHKLLSVSNSTFARNSTFTAANGVIHMGVAHVVPGGRNGGKKLLSLGNSNVSIKPPGYRTAPAVHPLGSQQSGRPVRVQPQFVRQQQQRGAWAKCSWWNKIMTLVDAVMRVQGRRKRC